MRYSSTLGAALALASLSLMCAAHAADIPQEANGYTRYELLAPDLGKFRIVYDYHGGMAPGCEGVFQPGSAKAARRRMNP